MSVIMLARHESYYFTMSYECNMLPALLLLEPDVARAINVGIPFQRNLAHRFSTQVELSVKTNAAHCFKFGIYQFGRIHLGNPLFKAYTIEMSNSPQTPHLPSH